MDESYKKSWQSHALMPQGFAKEPTIGHFPRQTLLILGLIATMVMYADTMLVPALLDIRNDFAIGYDLLPWVLTIYLLTGAVATPVIGKLGDMHGKKRMLLMVMGIYAVAVTLGGFAWDIWSLLAFRGVQGIGLAMFPLAFAIIRDQFPRERMGIAQGVLSSMFGIGSAIGLVIGGSITQNFGWRVTYHTIIPIVMVLTALVALKITKDSSTEIKTKLDLKGTSTLAVSLSSFLIGLTLGNSYGWSSPVVLFLFIVSVVTFVVFLLIEKRVTSPIVDLALVKARNILLNDFVIFIVGFSMFMVFGSIAILVRSPPPIGFNATVEQAGLVQLPFSLVMLVMGPVSGVLVTRVGPRRPMVIGMGIVTTGFIALIFFHSAALQVVLILAALGFGMSIGMIGTINMLILSVPRQSTGIQTALNTLFRIIGSVIGPVIAGVFMSANVIQVATGSITTVVPSNTAYTAIFSIAAIASATAVVLVAMTKDIRIRKDGVQITDGNPPGNK